MTRSLRNGMQDRLFPARVVDESRTSAAAQGRRGEVGALAATTPGRGNSLTPRLACCRSPGVEYLLGGIEQGGKNA